MNILLDALPDKIDGVPVNTDFRFMVLLELMLADPKVPQDMKLPLALSYLYKEPVSDLKKAVDGLMWFYRCGAPEESGAGGGNSRDRAYDFEVDAPDIYAAFMQTYGIDLNSVELHWWKFRALFFGLPEDCKIVKIMGYRTMDLHGLKGAEKKHYEKLKRQFRLKPLGVEKLPLAAAEQAAKDRVAKRFEEAERWKRDQTRQR